MAQWTDINNKNDPQYSRQFNRKMRHNLSKISPTQITSSPDGIMSLAAGGTGATLTAPAGDRFLFYDKSGNAVDWLVPGSGIIITGTTITANNFGNLADGDYSEFEADGTYKANGKATTFDDLLGDITRLKIVGVGLVADDNENAIKFQTTANLSDYVISNYQNRHRWKAGSNVYPHIHFEQAQNNVPNFLIRYRWQRTLGAKTTAWTDYKCNTLATTYSSGTLNQIAYGAAITPPAGYSLSDMIQFRVFRDNANTSTVFAGADPYTTDVLVTGVDIHIEEDTLGSRTEYSK